MSDPLSIATGIITLIEATAKATEYVKDVKSGGKERTKLRDELRSVTCLLKYSTIGLKSRTSPTMMRVSDQPLLHRWQALTGRWRG